MNPTFKLDLSFVPNSVPEFQDMNLRRKLEDALDSVSANLWMRTMARRIAKQVGFAHALSTVKNWEESYA